jgi:hypothetical protein
LVVDVAAKGARLWKRKSQFVILVVVRYLLSLRGDRRRITWDNIPIAALRLWRRT